MADGKSADRESGAWTEDSATCVHCLVLNLHLAQSRRAEFNKKKSVMLCAPVSYGLTSYIPFQHEAATIYGMTQIQGAEGDTKKGGSSLLARQVAQGNLYRADYSDPTSMEAASQPHSFAKGCVLHTA
jgi:hypothetical protein